LLKKEWARNVTGGKKICKFIRKRKKNRLDPNCLRNFTIILRSFYFSVTPEGYDPTCPKSKGQHSWMDWGSRQILAAGLSV
jgi:hypothetical protein